MIQCAGNDASREGCASPETHGERESVRETPGNENHDETRIAREMGLRLGVRLRSRKNKVYVVSRDTTTLILKVYDPEFASNSATEILVLRKASETGLAVPRLVDFREGQSLVMEYIRGVNLCDLVNDEIVLSPSDLERTARPADEAAIAEAAATRTPSLPSIPLELAKWFVDFHTATGMLRGDSILRNFIMAGAQGCPEEPGSARKEDRTGKVFGVDFEEARPGDPTIDIGEMVSSLLNTDPMFAPNKISFCEQFVSSYLELSGHADVRQVIRAAVSSLRTAASRRPRQRGMLLQGAKVLEDEGFRRLSSLPHH